MSSDLPSRLAEFQTAYGFRGKDGLSVALHITRYAREHGLPLDPTDLLAQSGAQASGLEERGSRKFLRTMALYGHSKQKVVAPVAAA